MNPGSLKEHLARWRAGGADAAEAAGAVLRHFEPWLRFLAASQLASVMGAKCSPSDIVQQTLAGAARDFPQFRGGGEGEFAVWLRRILAHVMAHEVRRYRGTRKRDMDLEVSLDQDLATASVRLGDMLAGDAVSPSQAAVRGERERTLARLLDRLPEDYRRVLVLRHLEGRSHEEIALMLGRQAGAVRMLWVRALARLRREAEAEGWSGGMS